MKTRFTEVLGIEYPVMMGAMAWVTEANIVSAVSNGGGAGVLAAGGRDEDWVRTQLRKTKTMTDKPFGINLSLESTPWRDKLVDVILEEGVPFVTLGAGDPTPFIPKFQAVNIKTVCIVPNTRLAKKVEKAGADIVVIEGMEAGGRIGTQTTFALMTNVLPEIDIPVVVAGGVADGRGLAAALIMGADGVQMGSRFLLSSECGAYPANAQAIIAATDTDSVVTGLSRGMGMRGLRSAFSDKYLELETSGAPLEELNVFAIGASRKVAEEGVGKDGMNGMVQCGQSLVPLKKIQPAAEIIQEVVTEAEKVLKFGPSKVLS